MFGIQIVDQPDQPPCFDRGTCGYIYIVGANLQGSLGPKQTWQVKAKKVMSARFSSPCGVWIFPDTNSVVQGTTPERNELFIYVTSRIPGLE